MWERRYGFPKPFRDDNGERRYSVAEVAKLRAIKRLMDVGLRPGKIIHHTQDELNALAEGRIATRREQTAPAVEGEILALLSRHDASGAAELVREPADAAGAAAFRARDADLAQPRGRRGLDAGGARGVRGAPVHGAAAGCAAHRHQRVSAAGRRAQGIADDVSRRAARPGSPDGRGAARAGRRAVHFARACRPRSRTSGAPRVAHDVHVVALSFSGAFPVRQAGEGLASLRRQLPRRVRRVGRRRNDPPRAQGAAGRVARAGHRRDDRGIEGLADRSGTRRHRCRHPAPTR